MLLDSHPPPNLYTVLRTLKETLRLINTSPSLLCEPAFRDKCPPDPQKHHVPMTLPLYFICTVYPRHCSKPDDTYTCPIHCPYSGQQPLARQNSHSRFFPGPLPGFFAARAGMATPIRGDHSRLRRANMQKPSKFCPYPPTRFRPQRPQLHRTKHRNLLSNSISDTTRNVLWIPSCHPILFPCREGREQPEMSTSMSIPLLSNLLFSFLSSFPPRPIITAALFRNQELSDHLPDSVHSTPHN